MQRCSKHKMSEKLKLILSRTKPAIRRHSRSYGKDCQCPVIGKKNKTWCEYFMLAATPRRPPGCPLKFASGAAVFAFPPLWSLPPGAPSAGAKNTFAPSPHNRSHPWRGILLFTGWILRTRIGSYRTNNSGCSLFGLKMYVPVKIVE